MSNTQNLNRRELLMAGALLPMMSLFMDSAVGSDLTPSSSMPSKNYPAHSIKEIERLIETSIENGLSGAVVHFGNRDGCLYQKAFGYQRRYNEKKLMKYPQRMHENTMFDLASLTKIFSTMLLYHLLLDRKEINLDDKVSKFFPDFGAPDKKDITLRLLLQHNSGFPSSFHFYNPADSGSAMYSQNHDRTIELLPKVPLAYTPGTQTIYSDLNFVTLGALIEKITDMRQDKFLESEICAGLGLKKTGYMLLKKGHKPEDFAASERCGNTRDGNAWFPNIRTQTLQGEVQDETAFYAMEQISGNAGLFSNVHDLGVLCRLLLNEGSLGNYRLCSPGIVNLFRTTFNVDKTYSLGWQLASPLTSCLYGLISPLISPFGQVVAHTGWTGKCVIIDFMHNSYFILLTNKKHSPVIPFPNYFNLFEADITPAGRYGNVADAFFRGMLETL